MHCCFHFTFNATKYVHKSSIIIMAIDCHPNSHGSLEKSFQSTGTETCSLSLHVSVHGLMNREGGMQCTDTSNVEACVCCIATRWVYCWFQSSPVKILLATCMVINISTLDLLGPQSRLLDVSSLLGILHHC